MSTAPQTSGKPAKDDSNILTPVFRLSFPKVFVPEPYEDDPDGKKMYSITMLFDAEAQKSAEYARMRAKAKEALVKKFGEKIPDHIKRALKLPFRKCEEKAHLAGYEPGMIFVRASSSRKPQLMDQRKNKITQEGDGERLLYPGCYCRAIIGAFAFDKKGNKGASFGLRAVQLVRHGDALGGGGPVDHLLDEVPDDDADFGTPTEGGDDFGDDFNDGNESSGDDFDALS